MTTATTTTRCTCGLNHAAQRQYFPVGTIVSSISRVGNHPHGEIPIGSTGKVTTHCDDGRAYIFFDDYPQGGHTFHQIDDYVRVVKLPEQPRPEEGSGEMHQVLTKGPDGFPCHCRCHVTVTIRQQTCVHCDSYQAYPVEQDDVPAVPERDKWTLSKPLTNQILADDLRRGNLAVSIYGIDVPESNNRIHFGAVVVFGDDERAAQIVTEHNQHSTLIEQRERLLRLLRPVTSPTACYCAVMGNEKCWHCEARELITTIEQEGTTR